MDVRRGKLKYPSGLPLHIIVMITQLAFSLQELDVMLAVLLHRPRNDLVDVSLITKSFYVI